MEESKCVVIEMSKALDKLFGEHTHYKFEKSKYSS